jgi:hypothetical protein
MYTNQRLSTTDGDGSRNLSIMAISCNLKRIEYRDFVKNSRVLYTWFLLRIGYFEYKIISPDTREKFKEQIG